jgi:hypothetical protein
MLITFEAGRRIGVARLARDPEGLTKGAGAAEGSASSGSTPPIRRWSMSAPACGTRYQLAEICMSEPFSVEGTCPA